MKFYHPDDTRSSCQPWAHQPLQVQPPSPPQQDAFSGESRPRRDPERAVFTGNIRPCRTPRALIAAFSIEETLRSCIVFLNLPDNCTTRRLPSREWVATERLVKNCAARSELQERQRSIRGH